MSTARKVTKQDFELLSDLVFKSFITREFEIANHHFVLRSLTTKEREDIPRKYKYLSNNYNIMLVLDILCNSIMFIDGLDFEKQKHESILRKFNSKLIFKLYEVYQTIDAEILESSRFIDYFLETKESRNMWAVFKTCSRIDNPFAIRMLNQYQFYWILTNVYKDAFEVEKKSWSKVEYMTNSICSFINPKGFKKAKTGTGIVEQLEQREDKEKKIVAEEIESGIVQEVVESNDVFSSMERQQEESDEQYEARINILMEKTLNGELVDEHDTLVRESEIKALKEYLREKRKQVLVERELYTRRGIEFSDMSIIENEAMQIQLEEDKLKGFFHDNFSYLEIIKMKDFAAVTKKEKEKAFDEVMSEEIDIESEIDSFLKSLSGQSNNDYKVLDKTEHNTIDEQHDVATQGETDQSDELVTLTRNAAEQAAKMNVDIKGVDLIEQRREKIRRATSAINRRNIKLEQDSNLDIMKFED